jgi:CP family cyanate transporter-like MFS transporter
VGEVVGATGSRRGAAVLAGAALVLVTLNLRFALAAVPQVLDDIRAALGLSASAAGLLTTLPVLCFGLAAPLAPALARRLGQELIVLGCMVAVVAGIAVRLVPAVAPLFAGTLVLGVGIAVANVLMPSIIKRRFARAGAMMGLYTASFSVAAALAAGLTVPLEEALGDWQWALGAWALPALLACLAWLPLARQGGAAPDPGSDRAVHLRADPVAWLVTGTFALQSALFYALLAWTPDILRAAGLSSGEAGAMVSLSMLCGIPASLLVPAVTVRRAAVVAAVGGGLWIAGLVGLLLAPGGATALWMVLLGVAQGMGIAYALTLVVLRAPDSRHAAALSGLSQGVGYIVASLLPFLLGALHDLTAGWDVPVLVLVALGTALLGCGLAAARPGMVGAGRAARAPAAPPG